MKDKICCVLSDDKGFAVKFMDYCNNRRILPFKMSAFTEIDALIESRKDNEIELVLADESLADEISHADICKKVVRLTEKMESDEESICKYQPADRLAKEVMGYFDNTMQKTTANRKYKIIGIYSPASRTYRTSFSLGLAGFYGKTKRTLWVNLEEFAGLSKLFGDNAGGGLSEAVYRYKVKEESREPNLVSCASKIGSFDVLYPAANPEDVNSFTIKEFTELADIMAGQGQYEIIIIDIGYAVTLPWEYADICDEVYFTEPHDSHGRMKFNEFKEFMNTKGGKSEKYKFISLPVIESFANKCILQDMVFSVEMEALVRRVISG